MKPDWITYNAWERIGYRHHHGIDIILSSLKTENSLGIGEFYDLFLLIDWCKEVGFDTLQLLPLNDTGGETSPYMALTSCGLNPIFLSLKSLPFLDSSFDKKFLPFEPLKNLPRIDYERVLEEKIRFLEDYYEAFSPRFLEMEEYRRFVEHNTWLEPYARFKGGDPGFHIFLQYLSFTQLHKVKQYANEKGVFLKGDIPILISRYSADVAHEPHHFNLDFSAGAPPDQYAHDGQNWGFPLYRWDEMEKENYRWWKERLQYAEHFYDIYRLDHIIGFFRIWAIPDGKKATEGFFIPADPQSQEKQGRAIFEKILPSTMMLPIGEDLGFAVGLAQTKMKEMGIPGMRVIRWMRNYDTDGSFIPYDAYPELSLTTVSTHDSEPLALWWEENPEEVKLFSSFRKAPYESVLSRSTRLELLKEAHHTSSLFHVNLLSEYLALFEELVWSNPENERINVPGLILPSNWTYRLRPSLEELLAHKGLKNAIQSILSPLSYSHVLRSTA